MGYTAVTTLATGNVFTATRWNTDVRDNLAWLHVPPMASARRTTALSIATSTWTSVTLPDAEEWDTSSMHSLVTNSNRFTCASTGIYSISGMVEFAANATGQRGIRFLIDGAGGQWLGPIGDAATSGVTRVSHTALISVTAGSYLGAEAWQSSGGALNISDARVHVAWIGATS